LQLRNQMFDKSIDFLLSVDIDKLHDEQLDMLSDIITKIETSAENIQEVKRAKKSLATVKQYARAYGRKNRISLKAKRKKIARSAEGRKRARAADRMAKAGKTPTGRKRIIYNTQKHVNL